MTIRSDAACPRCDGPALHPGNCTDADGTVYPAYAELAEAWHAQGRPALSAEEVQELQEAIQAAAEGDELPGLGSL